MSLESIKAKTIGSSSDPIWIDNFSILYKKDRFVEFFPTKEQTNEERINAIVRLSFYVSIILVMYHSNMKYSSIFIFFLLFTFIVYKNHPKVKLNTSSMKNEQEPLILHKNNDVLNNFTPSINTNANSVKDAEKFQGEPTNQNELSEGNGNQKICTAPTIDNPFMNFTMKDYMNFDKNGSIIDRPPACDPNNPDIKKQIDKSFNNNLFRDTNDLFGKMNSQRNYFTMPSTSIVNRADEFARWLYLNPATCKENQDACLKYEDIRGKPFIMPDPLKNPNNIGAKDKL